MSRVYWHAHHVLDVGVGVCIGLGTSATLTRLLPLAVPAVSWAHVLAAQAVLTAIAVAYKSTETIKKKPA